eukprot:s5082_g1.t1
MPRNAEIDAEDEDWEGDIDLSVFQQVRDQRDTARIIAKLEAQNRPRPEDTPEGERGASESHGNPGGDKERAEQMARYCFHACMYDSRLSMDENGGIVRAGEPTEAALRVLVEKLGCPDSAMSSQHLDHERSAASVMAFNDYWTRNIEKRATLEFARDRKSMSVLCNDPSIQPENILFVKGAPESILDRCTTLMLPDGTLQPLSEESRKAILDRMLQMAGEALRTLALAVKFDLKDAKLNDYDGPERLECSHRYTDPSFTNRSEV